MPGTLAGKRWRATAWTAFSGQMQEQATAGNLYISSLTPLTEMRTEALKSRMDNHKKKLAPDLVHDAEYLFRYRGHLWLRTQLRRGEIGLRMALGASRRTQKSFLFHRGVAPYLR